MFLAYSQVEVTSAVKTQAAITFPAVGYTGAMLQADTQNIRYTMDDATNPTNTSGMRLISGLDPEQFTADDLKRIRFVLEAGITGRLNIHFFGGRSI